MWVYWTAILKSYYYIWNEHSRICFIAKFGEKIKTFWIWDQIYMIWVFLDWNLKLMLSYLNQHPRTCLIANFCETLNLGSKIIFRWFWAKILNNYWHIWNQHPRIYQRWVFNSHISLKHIAWFNFENAF